MPVAVPATLKEALEPELLSSLDEAIGPPKESRIPGRYEIEVEAAGEGTFTIAFDDGAVSGKKGFAKGDPLLSCAIPKGGWPFVQRLLQAAADGFPAAPAVAERQARLRAMTKGELETAVRGVEKLREMVIEVDVSGMGVFRVARGSLDEATRQLKVAIAADAVDRVLAGAPLSTLSGAKVSGERGLVTEILAALGPVVTKIRR